MRTIQREDTVLDKQLEAGANGELLSHTLSYTVKEVYEEYVNVTSESGGIRTFARAELVATAREGWWLVA